MEENIVKFEEKLKELVSLGKKKKSILEVQEINDFFSDMELEPDQMEKVFEYLEGHNIDVLRISGDDDDLDDVDLMISEEDDVDMEKLDLSVPDGISIEDPVRMYLKEIGGDIYAGVDASQYDLGFAGEFKSPPYRVLNTSDNGKEICCSIVGCTCVETDVLTNEHWGRIQEGDVVLYENVGAYTCNLSRLFIKPCLPVVEYDGESYTEVKQALSLAY